MKIGIDLDDVLIETFSPFLKFYNKKFNTKYALNDITSYFIWEIGLFETKEDAIKEVTGFQNSEEVGKVTLNEGVLEALRILSQKNKLLIVTSRHEELKDKTNEVVGNYFKEFNFSVIYSGDLHGGKKSKAEICLENNCEIMIEDNSETALNCAERGIKTILFNKPWNKNCEEHKNIIRVNNWGEILEKIKEIKNENLGGLKNGE